MNKLCILRMEAARLSGKYFWGVFAKAPALDVGTLRAALGCIRRPIHSGLDMVGICKKNSADFSEHGEGSGVVTTGKEV
jgi:hypothetical protein